MNCCPVSSTPCDLCSCKLLSCFIQWLKRRYIFKNIRCLTFKRDVKDTRYVAQYHLHHVTYALVKFEVATSKGLGGDAFTYTVM